MVIESGRSLRRQHLLAVTGARTCLPGLNALREASGSNIGALGYTVPYAIGNILLTISGPVEVAIMHSLRLKLCFCKRLEFFFAPGGATGSKWLAERCMRAVLTPPAATHSGATHPCATHRVEVARPLCPLVTHLLLALQAGIGLGRGLPPAAAVA